VAGGKTVKGTEQRWRKPKMRSKAWQFFSKVRTKKAH
jgi:hypothetical protein